MLCRVLGFSISPSLILLIVLGSLIVGIAISAAVIATQEHDVAGAQEDLIDDLSELAARAQEYYQLSLGSRGGKGSFEGLFRVPDGIKLLAPEMTSSPDAEFYLEELVNDTSVQIVGIGKTPGEDPAHPVKVMITVSPNDTWISVLN